MKLDLLLQQQQKEFDAIVPDLERVNRVEEMRHPIVVQIESKVFLHHDDIIHR